VDNYVTQGELLLNVPARKLSWVAGKITTCKAWWVVARAEVYHGQ